MSLASQISAGFARVAAEINALRSEVSGQSGGSGRAIFCIWAEENAALSDGATEWAFGNGANMPADQGVVVPVACELFAGALSLARGSAVVAIHRNGVKVAEVDSTGAASVKRVLNSYEPPIAFAAGDVVGFRTDSALDTGVGNTVTAWFRTP